MKIKVEHNIIKDVRSLFRLKKQIDNNAIKDIRNLFMLKKRKWSNQRQ